MNRLKQTKQFLVLLFTGALMFSCSENESSNNLSNIEQDSNFVNLANVENIVQEIKHRAEDTTLKAKGITSTTKTIKNINKIPDENGNTSFYVINYKEGGFLLLSADNRISPVLAYSNDSSFSINDSIKYPSSLIGWLYGTKEKIKEIRNSNKQQSKEVESAWNTEKIQDIVNGVGPEDIVTRVEPDEDDRNNCKNEYETVGPLIQTVWGQGDGYNNLVRQTGCTNYLNGHAPTGCVATAMAQIMKYHEFPSTYNWSSMPNAYGTNETSRLMRDIGSAVGMDYRCDGSSASTEDEVASSFRNDFNYSSASYTDYNSETVKRELRRNRPVILRGGRDSGWWIFHQYSDGHA